MKKKLIIGGVLVLLLVVGFVVGMPLYKLHFAKIDLKAGEKTIYVKTGTDLEGLADQVAAAGIVQKDVFIEFSDKLDFTNDKVEPGKYVIKGDMKIKELVYALKNGNQESLDTKITFNYCKDIFEMAGKVAPNIEADSASIVNYILQPETINKYGFKKETIGALFLPDTYEVGEWDMSPEEFVAFMAEQYKAFWNEEGVGRGSKLADLGLEQSEVTTVASIVVAEQSKKPEEWPTIAGLYLNRIRDNWKLESDPTFKFCWGNQLDTVYRLLNEHRDIDCPYNTYKYAGLPPGPINMPSKKAIDAVLNAEDHDYYFMCAQPNYSGLHNFAHGLTEHNRNAAVYRRWLKSEGY